MKKRGRPTKAASDRRETVIHFRMTREEYRALSAAAKKVGLNVSEYARKKIIGR